MAGPDGPRRSDNARYEKLGRFAVGRVSLILLGTLSCAPCAGAVSDFAPSTLRPCPNYSMRTRVHVPTTWRYMCTAVHGVQRVVHAV